MELASKRLLSTSPEETFALGRGLGERLPAGAVLALVGDLGAGKTLFTKGLACGLGVREHERVNSPTFVIQQQYLGRLPIFHFDAYRLAGSADLWALGFAETLERRGVVVVEWADRTPEAMPQRALKVVFESAGGEFDARNAAAPGRCRSLTLSGLVGDWGAILDGLKVALKI